MSLVARKKQPAESGTPPTISEAESRRDRKLSEVTKKLVVPVDITGSYWPDVRDTCNERLGIFLDRWQDGIAGLLLAHREDGVIAHTIGGFGLSICRQVGKTHTLTAVLFGLCVEHPGLLAIWTSHHVKALAWDTPILTVNRGWVTMADMRVGDEVIHPSGEATRVTEVSDMFLGNDCYEVETTDGRSLVADAGHLWTVTDMYRQGSSGSGKDRKRWILPPVTMTTEQIASHRLADVNRAVTRGKAHETASYRFRLPEQAGISALPDVDLSVDPYLLGAWLGDGTSACAAITCAKEDLAHWSREIGKAGYLAVARKYPDRAWRIGIRGGFQGRLRTLGVLNNKHVPDAYLLASADQRLALLQGLMDTDGTISREGNAYFTSTTRDLAESVRFLARSLGWRATINERKVKKCLYWQVTFTPRVSDGISPFRLERKHERVRDVASVDTRRRCSIKAITPVATRPTRCIKVAAPDGLFLAGRDLIPTHNTNSETFQAVQAFCKREKVKPFIKRVYLGSGDEAVEFTNGSRILFGARERGFGRGIPGVDVLMSDEAQILSQRAMQDMLATLNTSRLGLHIYVGTPPKPTDNSEMFRVMRQEAWSGEATDIAWIECGADEDADTEDVDQWMKANPSCPHRTPVVSIQRLRRRLDDDGFRREALGIWDSDEASTFDIAAWSDLADRGADTPSSAALVIDMSPDRRHCWIGAAGEIDTDNGSRVLLMATEVKAANAVSQVQKMMSSRNIVEVAITGGAARALEPALVEACVEYKRLTQSDAAAAYSTMQEAIKNATICHLDQDELNTAMVMTRTRFIVSGESEVFDRRKYSVNLSPAVACACALYRWGMVAAPMPVLL